MRCAFPSYDIAFKGARGELVLGHEVVAVADQYRINREER
jgi:hypothetical protein